MCVRARVNNANQTIGLKWSMSFIRGRIVWKSLDSKSWLPGPHSPKIRRVNTKKRRKKVHLPKLPLILLFNCIKLRRIFNYKWNFLDIVIKHDEKIILKFLEWDDGTTIYVKKDFTSKNIYKYIYIYLFSWKLMRLKF